MNIEKNPFNLALYVSLFPHLIAGPIVRYKEIYKEISDRDSSSFIFVEGIVRFAEGLAKKTLVANNLAVVADQIFALSSDELSFTTSWLGVICYTLQIYFDFSAYSDMAIGLARMFGFHFPENFNYPYLATSIKDFWSRWHISLSRWFKDYVYIPLGGNRVGAVKTYRNLFIVFLLTGIWHGASWTFMIWGAYYGVLLIIEKIFQKRLEKIHIGIRYLSTIVVVIFGWVLFRADDITYAFNYWTHMLGIGSHEGYYSARELMNSEIIIALVIGTFLALNLHNRIWQFILSLAKINLKENFSYLIITSFYKLLKIIMLVSLGAIYLAEGTYNPFIYFRF